VQPGDGAASAPQATVQKNLIEMGAIFDPKKEKRKRRQANIGRDK
jgi:hypothetical protein